MDDLPPVPEFNPEDNQPPVWQWVLIGGVALLTLCGISLFLIGTFFTANSWFEGRQAQATEQIVEATAIVVERDATLRRAEQWPLVLFDTFDENQSEWLVDPIEDEYAKIQLSIDGAYRWEATSKQGFLWRVWPDAPATKDFYLAIDAQNAGDNVNAQYGLTFRDDDASYYYWEVIDTQYFRFFSYYEYEWIELIGSTYADAIIPGGINHLVVVSEDDLFKFWINDQFVGQANGSYPTQGEVGVIVGISYEGETGLIAFDNFEVRVPALPTESQP